MTTEEMRLKRIEFKRFMHGQLKLMAALCAISSILAVILLLCFPYRFIRERIVISVLIVYIVYVILSLIDVILLWIHKNNPVSTDIAEFTGNTGNNTTINKKDKKGVKDHAGRNDKDSNRSDEASK